MNEIKLNELKLQKLFVYLENQQTTINSFRDSVEERFQRIFKELDEIKERQISKTEKSKPIIPTTTAPTPQSISNDLLKDYEIIEKQEEIAKIEEVQQVSKSKERKRKLPINFNLENDLFDPRDEPLCNNKRLISKFTRSRQMR